MGSVMIPFYRRESEVENFAHDGMISGVYIQAV